MPSTFFKIIYCIFDYKKIEEIGVGGGGGI